MSFHGAWVAVVTTVSVWSLGAGALQAQSKAQAKAIDAEVRAQLDSSAAGWNRGDVQAHLATNSDSIWFMTPNGPVVGNDKVVDMMSQSFFRDGKAIQNLRFERVTVRPLGNDHALVVGNFILSGGEQPDQSGWFSTVWERQKQGWRVIHDHSS